MNRIKTNRSRQALSMLLAVMLMLGAFALFPVRAHAVPEQVTYDSVPARTVGEVIDLEIAFTPITTISRIMSSNAASFGLNASLGGGNVVSLQGTFTSEGTISIMVEDADSPFSSYTCLINVYNETTITDPVDTNITEGGTGSLTVTGSGTARNGATLTYQWFKGDPATATAVSDGSGILGATTSTLTFANADSSHAGDYYCVATSSVGNRQGYIAYSNSATLSVISSGYPAFTTHPANRSVTGWGTVTFTAVASDATSLKWQKSDDDGATWNDVENFSGKYSGINSGTLTITGATAAWTTHQYRCAATNASGTTYSRAATLTVTDVLVTGITLNESSKTIEVGGSFTLTHTLTPSNASHPEVNYYSGNTAAATVGDWSGEVTGVAPGTAVITAYALDGSTDDPHDGMDHAACTVTVVNKTTLRAAIASGELAKAVGHTFTTGTYNPLSDALNAAKGVRDDADSTQAEIDTAAGDLQTALNGLKKRISGVEISAPGGVTSMLKGGTLQLSAAAVPSDADSTLPRGVTWASSDPLTASIDADGLVTALKTGTVIITVTQARQPGEDFPFTDTYTIIIREDSNPDTGDSDMMTGWLAMLAVSSAGFLILLKKRTAAK